MRSRRYLVAFILPPMFVQRRSLRPPLALRAYLAGDGVVAREAPLGCVALWAAVVGFALRERDPAARDRYAGVSHI